MSYCRVIYSLKSELRTCSWSDGYRRTTLTNVDGATQPTNVHELQFNATSFTGVPNVQVLLHSDSLGSSTEPDEIILLCNITQGSAAMNLNLNSFYQPDQFEPFPWPLLTAAQTPRILIPGSTRETDTIGFLSGLLNVPVANGIASPIAVVDVCITGHGVGAWVGGAVIKAPPAAERGGYGTALGTRAIDLNQRRLRRTRATFATPVDPTTNPPVRRLQINLDGFTDPVFSNLADKSHNSDPADVFDGFPYTGPETNRFATYNTFFPATQGTPPAITNNTVVSNLRCMGVLDLFFEEITLQLQTAGSNLFNAFIPADRATLITQLIDIRRFNTAAYIGDFACDKNVTGTFPVIPWSTIAVTPAPATANAVYSDIKGWMREYWSFIHITP
jgi:hypothetical protein